MSLRRKAWATICSPAPLPEPRTFAACFGQAMWDSLAHGGQIAYLRRLFLGVGWRR